MLNSEHYNMDLNIYFIIIAILALQANTVESKVSLPRKRFGTLRRIADRIGLSGKPGIEKPLVPMRPPNAIEKPLVPMRPPNAIEKPLVPIQPPMAMPDSPNAIEKPLVPMRPPNAIEKPLVPIQPPMAMPDSSETGVPIIPERPEVMGGATKPEGNPVMESGVTSASGTEMGPGVTPAINKQPIFTEEMIKHRNVPEFDHKLTELNNKFLRVRGIPESLLNDPDIDSRLTSFNNLFLDFYFYELHQEGNRNPYGLFKPYGLDTNTPSTSNSPSQNPSKPQSNQDVANSN